MFGLHLLLRKISGSSSAPLCLPTVSIRLPDKWKTVWDSKYFKYKINCCKQYIQKKYSVSELEMKPPRRTIFHADRWTEIPIKCKGEVICFVAMQCWHHLAAYCCIHQLTPFFFHGVFTSIVVTNVYILLEAAAFFCELVLLVSSMEGSHALRCHDVCQH